jgi:hypothetical protein
MLELDDCLIATALATLACTGCASTLKSCKRTQRTAPARSLAKP